MEKIMNSHGQRFQDVETKKTKKDKALDTVAVLMEKNLFCTFTCSNMCSLRLIGW